MWLWSARELEFKLWNLSPSPYCITPSYVDICIYVIAYVHVCVYVHMMQTRESVYVIAQSVHF